MNNKNINNNNIVKVLLAIILVTGNINCSGAQAGSKAPIDETDSITTISADTDTSSCITENCAADSGTSDDVGSETQNSLEIAQEDAVDSHDTSVSEAETGSSTEENKKNEKTSPNEVSNNEAEESGASENTENSTDWKDQLAEIFQSKKGTWVHKKSDQSDDQEDEETSSISGHTVLWNGTNVKLNDTVNKNQQYGGITSLLSFSTNNAGSELTVKNQSGFAADNGKSTTSFGNYYTVVKANENYLRFWHGQVVFSSYKGSLETSSGNSAQNFSKCQSNNSCETTFKIYLKEKDNYGNQIDSAWLKNKAFFVMLQGIDATTGNKTKFNTLLADIDTENTVINSDGSISLTATLELSDSKDTTSENLGGSVNYVVGVYDQNYVHVSEKFDEQILTDENCDSSNCSVTAETGFSGFAKTSIACGSDSSDSCANQWQTGFVGLSSWGFNTQAPRVSDSEGLLFEVNRIQGYAALNTLTEDTAAINVAGEAFHAANKKKNREILPANHINPRIISCKSESVCSGMFISDDGGKSKEDTKSWTTTHAL